MCVSKARNLKKYYLLVSSRSNLLLLGWLGNSFVGSWLPAADGVAEVGGDVT